MAFLKRNNQYNGISKPKQGLIIDDDLPDGLQTSTLYCNLRYNCYNMSGRGYEHGFKTAKDISTLSEISASYPLTVQEPWHTHGVRKMTVGHFLVYYWMDEENLTVWITAIIYGRRDQLSALRNMLQ